MNLEQQQALALAAARRRKAAQATTPAATGVRPSDVPFERAGLASLGAVGSGVAQAGIKGALGVKQLFGGLSDDDKAVLREVESESKAEPNKKSRLLGDIAANVALTAVPASKVERVARGGRALTGATSAVRAALAAGAGAGVTEAVLGVGEGETFGEQITNKAAGAGKAALLAGGTGGALQKATRVFKPSAEAEQLMKMGITPTLQQGADGKVGRFVGGLSGGAFSTGVATRQNDEVLKETLRRIDPNADYTDARLSEIIGMAGKNLDGEFDKLFQGKKFTMTAGDKASIWKAARRAAGNEPDVTANVLSELSRTGQALRSNNTITLGQGGMRTQRNMLQDRINAVGREQTTKSGDVKQGLIAAKNKFDQIVRDTKLSPAEQLDLKDLNSRMSDFKRLEDMAMSPASHKAFKATSLLNSFAKMDPKGGAGFARAENPLQNAVLEPAVRVLNLAGQDDTRAGLVALRRALPFAAASGAGAGVAGLTAAGMPALAVPLAAGYGLSLLGQSKQGANVLLGNTALQRAAAAQLRKGIAAPAGAAMYEGYSGEEQ